MIDSSSSFKKKIKKERKEEKENHLHIYSSLMDPDEEKNPKLVCVLPE